MLGVITELGKGSGMEKHGRIWWNELMTRDVPAAVGHYGKLCGWTFETVPMQDAELGEFVYYIAMLGGMPVAGIMDMSVMPEDEARAPYWFTYIAVDDLDAALADTVAGGGRVKRAPYEVPGTGRIAIAIDPSGAEVGYMTPDEMPD